MSTVYIYVEREWANGAGGYGAIIVVVFVVTVVRFKVHDISHLIWPVKTDFDIYTESCTDNVHTLTHTAFCSISRTNRMNKKERHSSSIGVSRARCFFLSFSLSSSLSSPLSLYLTDEHSSQSVNNFDKGYMSYWATQNDQCWLCDYICSLNAVLSH